MKFVGTRTASIVIAFLTCYAIQAMALAQRNDYLERMVVLAGLYVTLAVSLNLINGITGQFSIGHAAFYQVGAYSAGFMTHQAVQKGGQISLPWLLGMIGVGAVAAAVAGLVVGLPSLRLRGDYLAIVTLGFGEIIRIIVQNIESLGGSYGLTVPKPQFEFVWLVWLLAVVCIALCRNLLKTAHGLPFLAVREDEVASAAMGVNVTKVKVMAFIIGSAFAGAAGVLLAHYEGFITPQTFRMDVSFIILTMVVLGGTGSITGSALAAMFLAYLPEYLRGLKGTDGQALLVSGASVVSGLIATAIVVGLIKWTMEHSHASRLARTGIYAGLAVAGILLQLALATALEGFGPPLLIAFFLAFVAYSATRWAIDSPDRSTLVPRLLVSVVASGVFLWQIFKTITSPIAEEANKLAGANIEASQLRMVIFAVTLIVLMLLRPQGVFAHHEFSWSWVRKLLGARKVPETEVAA